MARVSLTGDTGPEEGFFDFINISHVNSPECIKAAKPTQSAALKLSPSRSRGMRVMIRRKMSSVRGRRRFRLPSPYWRFAPLITRSIRGSLNEELSQPFSI